MGRSVKLDVSPTHLLIWSCIASQLRQRWKRELSQVDIWRGLPLYKYKWDLALVALCMSTSISGYLALVALCIRSLHLMGSGNLMPVQVDSIFGH